MSLSDVDDQEVNVMGDESVSSTRSPLVDADGNFAEEEVGEPGLDSEAATSLSEAVAKATLLLSSFHSDDGEAASDDLDSGLDCDDDDDDDGSLAEELSNLEEYEQKLADKLRAADTLVRPPGLGKGRRARARRARERREQEALCQGSAERDAVEGSHLGQPPSKSSRPEIYTEKVGLVPSPSESKRQVVRPPGEGTGRTSRRRRAKERKEKGLERDEVCDEGDDFALNSPEKHSYPRSYSSPNHYMQKSQLRSPASNSRNQDTRLADNTIGLTSQRGDSRKQGEKMMQTGTGWADVVQARSSHRTSFSSQASLEVADRAAVGRGSYKEVARPPGQGKGRRARARWAKEKRDKDQRSVSTEGRSFNRSERPIN